MSAKDYLGSNNIFGYCLVGFIAIMVIVGLCCDNAKSGTAIQPPVQHVPVNSVGVSKIIRFGYDGHDYIEFYNAGGKYSIVHDPDCHCFEDSKDLIDKMQMEYYD